MTDAQSSATQITPLAKSDFSHETVLLYETVDAVLGKTPTKKQSKKVTGSQDKFSVIFVAATRLQKK